MAKPRLQELEHFYAPDRAAWRNWLETYHAASPGVWLIYYKKESGKPRVSYDEAVEEALCFGWIDSLPNKIDEESYKQLFSPRKPKSNWSKLNKERVEKLLAQGLIAEAGLKSIAIAKSNGHWDALNEVEKLEAPADLISALESLPPAAEYWETFPKSVKRGILEWISNAKRPETRAQRIQKTASMAAENKRANFDN